MKTFLYEESEVSRVNQMAWRSELLMMNIMNMTLKNKNMALKNLSEMREMTLNDLVVVDLGGMKGFIDNGAINHQPWSHWTQERIGNIVA